MSYPTITVETYNPDWAKHFAYLKDQIWPAINECAVTIEHVGSTSVPGLAAKPIIDMDIIVEDLARLQAAIQALESIGYIHRGNLGIEEREAFRVPQDSIKHNLYVCTKDCSALKNHLFLRDHLRENPQSRDLYGNLKQKLALTALSIDEYIEGKTAFIVDVLSRSDLSAQDLRNIRKSNEQSTKKMIVRANEQIAEVWDENKILKTYRISTSFNGLGCEVGSYCTPTGKQRVASKIGGTLPIGAVLRSRVPTGEIWSTDPANPLTTSKEDLVLTRLLWLEGAEDHNENTFKRYVYLHGTNQEHLLGKPASHGCIRFSNRDIIEVFDALQAGNEVEVC
ncbi:MAG: GrpB family protein [Proteobacteria bacterium]|nr:GrpB family protein [Pseudomonadota bacterium]